MTQYSDPPLSGGTDPLSGRYPGGVPEPSTGRGESSTADVAKGQAGEVANTAGDAGKHVAGVAGEQAQQVASETTQQVKQLLAQTRGELTEQAASQQKRVASGLRSLGEELTAMAKASEQSGMATDLAHQAGERTSAVASWLEQREPGNVVDEVTRFARQRPGAFLAITAGAGLLLGRLGRGLKAANDDSNESSADASAQGSGGTPTYGTGDNSREGYATTPLPPVPAYPPAPGYQQPAPGYQQPAPGYQQPAPGYQQPAPGYQQPPPGYQQPQAPGYPQGRTGRDLAP